MNTCVFPSRASRTWAEYSLCLPVTTISTHQKEIGQDQPPNTTVETPSIFTFFSDGSVHLFARQNEGDRRQFASAPGRPGVLCNRHRPVTVDMSVSGQAEVIALVPKRRTRLRKQKHVGLTGTTPNRFGCRNWVFSCSRCSRLLLLFESGMQWGSISLTVR